jgi:hypothetical protein
LNDDKPKAKERLESLHDDLEQPVEVTTLACLAGLVGDADRRVTVLKQFGARHSKSAPKTTRAIEWLLEAIVAKKEPEQMNLQEFDAIVETIPKDSRGNTAFILAAYLAEVNRPDLAKRYWEMVTSGSRSSTWWKCIARHRLDRASNRDPAEHGTAKAVTE